MKRDKAWRIWKESLVVKKRLSRYAQVSNWYRFIDANDNRIVNPRMEDFIGTDYHHKSKRGSAIGAYNNIKFSPNRGDWRGGKRNKMREKYKQDMIKMKKEYGL